MYIRTASEKDCRALLSIYAEYIDTPITFEYTLPSEEEFKKRIKDFGAVYPYIVCIDGERPVGYAYAHRLWEREAYSWNAELSIYIDKEYTGRGIGRRLYETLIDILKKMNVRKVYGIVRTPNAGSEALHRSLGFKTAAVFKNSGYKNSEWHDVTWFEKDLADDSAAPKKIISAAEAAGRDIHIEI